MEWNGAARDRSGLDDDTMIVRRPRSMSSNDLNDANLNRSDLKDIVHSDPEIMGGTPVFVGTRVPLQNLIDYLEGGESIEDFLDGFPSVKRDQVLAVIQAGKTKMLESITPCGS
jgi:uncharacterized protein (DUF433 family)